MRDLIIELVATTRGGPRNAANRLHAGDHQRYSITAREHNMLLTAEIAPVEASIPLRFN